MMKKHILLSLILWFSVANAFAQEPYNMVTPDGEVTTRDQNHVKNDSLGSNKEIPIGIKVWNVDPRFGDVRPTTPDTLSYMFMNTIFTEGIRGQYNTTGNLGAPRISRIFYQNSDEEQFIFLKPYDFFIIRPEKYLFTNTLSPITTLEYNNCGNKNNGEDHFTAKFAVNVNKRLGIGFNFDYLYGRGFYQNQSTSHMGYTFHGSYLGDCYQAHFLFNSNHQKVTENGGITNDEYIKHPENFNETFQEHEIPTILAKNWNRNDNKHLFFSHRYNLGFSKKVPMTPEEIKAKKFAEESKKDAEKEKKRKKNQDDKEDIDYQGRPDDALIVDKKMTNDSTTNDRIQVTSKAQADSLLALKNKEDWMKEIYVPVTSFIHTLKIDQYRRIYQAYQTPENYYKKNYYNHAQPNDNIVLHNDSIYDKTTMLDIKNTFAISLLEGFNKWAQAGLKGFVTSEYRKIELPTPDNTGIQKYHEHNLSAGGQLSRTLARHLTYDVVAETYFLGKDAGSLKIDADVNLKFKLLGDTMSISASGFMHRINPAFHYRHFHSIHLSWDNDKLDKILHSRIQGTLAYDKTQTLITVAIDHIKNHTCFAYGNEFEKEQAINHHVNVLQFSKSIGVFTASIDQKLNLGILHWDNNITLQKTTDAHIIPLPLINVYSNLYLRFKIARVLDCDLGADARYFTLYQAPTYAPIIGNYAIQDTSKPIMIGNYPIVNAYANFKLKRARFFIMASHVNEGLGSKQYFLTPHYPINGRLIRMGLSWNFFN